MNKQKPFLEREEKKKKKKKTPHKRSVLLFYDIRPLKQCIWVFFPPKIPTPFCSRTEHIFFFCLIFFPSIIYYTPTPPSSNFNQRFGNVLRTPWGTLGACCRPF